MGPAGQSPQIVLKLGDKILCYGDFKMGKSTLAEFLTRKFPSYLVWDPGYSWKWGTRDWSRVEPMMRQYGRVVYQPGTGNLEGPFSRFCAYALTLSNTCILIDEPRKRLLDTQEFDDFIRLGHKRGNVTILCPHSLWDLPHVAQQYNHFFIFRVTRAVDQNVLTQIVPREAAEWAKTAQPRHFWHQTPAGGYATTGLDLAARPATTPRPDARMPNKA